MNKIDKVICLGKEFSSEEERRQFFRNELRTKLPNLKKLEGFPIGEDEDIINLSDPPYFTVCPNPWLNDFITEWGKEKNRIPGRDKEFHIEEPYAGDVSEGKNNSIYKAHSYHTKVPHPAVMRYLLHYTQPGDIILDGFSGTGMTGVASLLCGRPDSEFKSKVEADYKRGIISNKPTWGIRHCLLGDLSPAANFIAYNYNFKSKGADIIDTVTSALNKVELNFGWMYETRHTNGKIGKINFCVLSDVFQCKTCNDEFSYFGTGYNYQNNEHIENIKCPKCQTINVKSDLNKARETYFDTTLNQPISKIKQVVVLINYSFGGKRFEKYPDEYDKECLTKIKEYSISTWIPIQRMPEGDESRRNDKVGITHIHHFFTKRNLIYLSEFFKEISKSPHFLNTLFLLTGIIPRASLMHKFKKGQTTGTTSGTLYIPSLIYEYNVKKMLDERSRYTRSIYKEIYDSVNIVTNQSASSYTNLLDNSIDYIFTDPPFGANLMYSELNFIWEAWLKVLTANKSEAIENKSQGKSTLDYQNIMTDCFKEYYRVLKPNKWMTVEFSNTSASVWNGIQTALQRAGFVIANVAGLDKKQGSFKAVTTPTAVKQDLVISCYKPNSEFENQFKDQHSEVAVWDFVSQHLDHLPAYIRKDNSTTAIVERGSKILYDRLITFYLMRGLPIPIDAKDFQEGLKQRFIERDGMYFTAEQAAEYDEKKAQSPNFVQLSLIVNNESDAIEWLKDRLRKQAQKYQDIMPDFRIATQSLRKGDTLPELQDILNENFIQESDGRWRTPDPNEAKDRDALRTKVLLKEFNGYVTAIGQPKAKKLKEVRVEALRAGFKNCWEQKDFKTIVNLGDMIPQNILLEDEQLLMYYDIAKDRV